uniref:Uncharacterized protein n=1 Tax=Leersia perrieri TaxID=77586 RepID=A0A0D9XI20_9ORYZ
MAVIGTLGARNPSAIGSALIRYSSISSSENPTAARNSGIGISPNTLGDGSAQNTSPYDRSVAASDSRGALAEAARLSIGTTIPPAPVETMTRMTGFPPFFLLACSTSRLRSAMKEENTMAGMPGGAGE